MCFLIMWRDISALSEGYKSIYIAICDIQEADFKYFYNYSMWGV
jgi:hypothetical protein